MEQQATVFVNGEEVWTGPWWKVWKRVLSITAEQRLEKPTITVEFSEGE